MTYYFYFCLAGAHVQSFYFASGEERGESNFCKRKNDVDPRNFTMRCTGAGAAGRDTPKVLLFRATRNLGERFYHYQKSLRKKKKNKKSCHSFTW